jgi:hypothetical protein
MPMTEDRLPAYALHVRAIATYDLEQMPAAALTPG